MTEQNRIVRRPFLGQSRHPRAAKRLPTTEGGDFRL